MAQVRTQLVMGTVISTMLACQAVSAEPQTFNLDGDHTHIVWQVDRFGFANTVGTFAGIEGKLVLDESNPEQSRVTAKMALSGLRSDLLQREEIVRGKFWLDAASHPLITYSSTSVKLLDGPGCENRCATVVGDLTLKGVTRPVSMHVRLNRIGIDPVSKKKAAGFNATGSFKRSDFGITTAIGPVGDQVSFEIQALAVASD